MSSSGTEEPSESEVVSETGVSRESEQLRDVLEKLEELHDLFRRRLSTDRTNAKAIDSLHEGLQEARRWQEFALLKPLFLELILLLDRVDALVASKDDEHLTSIRQELLEILSRRLVTPTTSEAEEFDPKKHEVLSVEETSDPQLDRRVLSVERRGYSLDGSVLRPAGVVIARAVATPPPP